MIDLEDHRPEDMGYAATLLASEWSQHDEIALARLTPEERERQGDARLELHEYVSDYWENAKERLGNVVYESPEWQCVAGMKDLLDAMLGVVNAADFQELRERRKRERRR